MGFALVVVTNQSGIARGMFTEDTFMRLTEWMDWSLADRDVDLDGIYFNKLEVIDLMDIAIVDIKGAITIKKNSGDFIRHVETPAVKIADQYRMIAIKGRMSD